MKLRIYSFLFFLFLLIADAAHSQNLERFHRKATLVDTHNDALTEQTLEGKDLSQPLATGHSDLYRWRAGGMNVQFMSVWTSDTARNTAGFYADANQEIDSLELLVLRNHQQMALARSVHEMKKGIRMNKLVFFIGVEGGHMIEDDLLKLENLARRGMRYLTLTWNNSTSWASSAMDETAAERGEKKDLKKGLNEFGKAVVRRLNELGVMVDLSHVGEKAFYDALSVTTKPVLLSHSSVYSICPVFRNLKDEQIRAVAANKGVICINFYSGFISAEYDQRGEWLRVNRTRVQDSLLRIAGGDSAIMRRAWAVYQKLKMEEVRPGIEEVVDHIEYIARLVGVDYVGLGADYDVVSSVPKGLEDVSRYGAITEELMRRGFSRKSVKKILGKNVIRVMKANFN